MSRSKPAVISCIGSHNRLTKWLEPRFSLQSSPLGDGEEEGAEAEHPVVLDSATVLDGCLTVSGVVKVQNLAYHKLVTIRCISTYSKFGPGHFRVQ